MTKKERVKGVIEELEKKYQNPKCALNYNTPFELLIAVILSAQCTDKQVNIVTEKMFKIVNTPEKFYEMPLKEIEELVKSTGFYKNKAKNIKLCSEKIVKFYRGEVPKSMEELTGLNGVGRKTANVVRGEIWGLADGITVDTHVKRISNLIGLVAEKEPIKIELELMKIIPKGYWIKISHYLILHGRETCIARRPKCQICVISEYCKNNKS